MKYRRMKVILVVDNAFLKCHFKKTIIARRQDEAIFL
jgi:hypothetical protein